MSLRPAAKRAFSFGAWPAMGLAALLEEETGQRDAGGRARILSPPRRRSRFENSLLREFSAVACSELRAWVVSASFVLLVDRWAWGATTRRNCALHAPSGASLMRGGERILARPPACRCRATRQEDQLILIASTVRTSVPHSRTTTPIVFDLGPCLEIGSGLGSESRLESGRIWIGIRI